MPSSSLVLLFQRISRIASAATFCIGFLVILGWTFDITTFKSLLSEWVTMKANTAIGFICCGASLWLLHQPALPRWLYRVVQGLILLSLAISLLTLMEYAFNWNLGIDQLLFQEAPQAIATSHPGRMAPNTAVNFLLLSSALFLLIGPSPNYWVIQGCSLIAFLIALLGLLGYLYHIKSLYGFSAYTRMALHTTLAFITLSGGLLLFRPTRGFMTVVVQEDAGGMMTRQLFLPVLGIPPILGWLILLGHRHKLYTDGVGMALFGVLSIVIFAALVWWNAQSLSRMDRHRREAETQSRIDAILAAQAVAHLSAVMNNLEDALLVTDRNYRICRFNPALATMFDLDQTQLMGQLCDVLKSPEIWALVTQTELQLKGERVQVKLPKGRIGQAIATPILQQPTAGELAVWLGSAVLIRDVTAEWEVDRMKTDFISLASHELRTPLASIMSFVTILEKTVLEGLPSPVEGNSSLQPALKNVTTYFDIMKTETERLMKLVNDLLDVARLEAGKLEWNMEWLNPSEVLDWAVVTTSNLFTSNQLSFKTQFDPDLPILWGDRDRLLQVMINLLSNAAKFTPPGGIVTLRVRQDDQPDSGLVFEVEDTGIGIAAPDQPRVFEKFQQVGNAHKTHGSGLGLSICKQIVEYHGGKIWVESQPGRGSTFTFTIPLRSVSCSYSYSQHLSHQNN